MTGRTPGETASSAGRWVPALLFFFSGSAALLYEVAWNRLLVLLMGNTAYALATILAVFMGGLALGSWLGSRLAARHAPAITRPLRLYGLLELGIGLSAALVPAALELLGPAVALGYRSFGRQVLLFNAWQLLLCALVLLVPVALMGATLPVLVEAAGRRHGGVALPTGLLYGANTAGACVGVLAGGLLLLPALGVRATLLTAGAVNLAVGLVALGLSRSREPAARQRPVPPTQPAPAPPVPLPAGDGAGLLLGGYLMLGFASMAAQVAWTRAATLSFGSFSHAFALIVGAFLLGLALGAPALGWLAHRFRQPLLLEAAVAALALATALTIPLLGGLPVRAAVAVARHGGSFWRLQAAQFATIFLVLLPATFLMGALLPLVSRALAAIRHAGAGDAAGRAYAANAVGTILGAVAGGFLLVPTLGMRNTLAAAALVQAGVAAVFLMSRRPIGRLSLPAAPAALVLVAAAVALAPQWDPRLMASGPWIRPVRLEARAGSAEARTLLQARPAPIFYREDAVTTVTVTEQGGRRSLFVGGKPEAGDTERTQALLGHLPALLHPDPERVLVIGLGSGETLAALLADPRVEHAACVELSPAVIEAARRYFQQEARPLEDPRTRLWVGDGRQHLALSEETYDLIVSQPGNPWMAGSSALFTREAFAQMARRLEPGGIAAVWIQGWMPPRQTALLLATFHSVFPSMDLWEAGPLGQYILTGSRDGAIPLDPERMQRRLRRVERASSSGGLHALGIQDPADLLGLWFTDGEALAPHLAPFPRNTDDRDRVSLPAAREVLANYAVETLALLRRWSGEAPGSTEPLESRLTRLRARLTPKDAPEERRDLRQRLEEIHHARLLVHQAYGLLEEASQAQDPDRADRLRDRARSLLDRARQINPRDPAIAH